MRVVDKIFWNYTFAMIAVAVVTESAAVFGVMGIGWILLKMMKTPDQDKERSRNWMAGKGYKTDNERIQ